MMLVGRAAVVLAALAAAYVLLPFVIDVVARIAPMIIVLWFIGAILRGVLRNLLG